MGRSSIGSGYNSPDRVIPDLGQLSDHGAPIWWPSITSHKDAWDVLQDDEAGSHFPNDSEGIGPEVSPFRIEFPLPFAGSTEWLAGERGRQDIHSSTPGLAVKFSDVSSPEGSVIEVSVSVSDPGLDDLLAVSVPLDIGDRPEVGVRVGESESEGEAAVSAETVEDVESGMYIHVILHLLKSRHPGTVLQLGLDVRRRRFPVPARADQEQDRRLMRARA